jgi:hypothetical protein
MFALVHRDSDYGRAADIQTALPVVEFTPVEGFTIFDWRGVIEMAKEIHAIDSSLVNFVDRLPDNGQTLYYYITDKVPMKADRTLLYKSWTTINELVEV